MKKVMYNNKKEFIITNQEFKQAISYWNNKQDFFCSRLGALLSHYYLYVEDTDEGYLNYDVYLLWHNLGFYRKVYKKDDKYFCLESDKKLHNINLTKKEKDSLINQEDYYTQKQLK